MASARSAPWCWLTGAASAPAPVDGRNYSDINQIPAALIERVDVLTGGASAVYGADAVAGVVNFILNTHFEGVKIDAGAHISSTHNTDSYFESLNTEAGYTPPDKNVGAGYGQSVSIIVGSNFADDKGNATAYATYDNQGAALQSKYDYSDCALGPHRLRRCLRRLPDQQERRCGYSSGLLQQRRESALTNTVDGTPGSSARSTARPTCTTTRRSTTTRRRTSAGPPAGS